MATSVFISHSHHDNEWCRPFQETLKAVGYDVWYDEVGLSGGAAWVDSIQREIQRRDVFVIILTPESWQSQWVQDELQLAIATRRRILPVLLRNTQVDGFLLTTQWVTAVGEEPQSAARNLILAIEAPPAPGRTAPVETEALDDLITLCKSLAAEKRYTEALSACARALTLDRDNHEALRVRYDVLVAIDEGKKAVATLTQLVTLFPNDEESLRLSALSNVGRGGRRPIDQVEEGEVMGLAQLLRWPDMRSALMRALQHTPSIVVKLGEAYFGYPPERATKNDSAALYWYEHALSGLGKAREARVVEKRRLALL